MQQLSNKNSEGREQSDLKDFIPPDPNWNKFKTILIVAVIIVLTIYKCMS